MASLKVSNGYEQSLAGLGKIRQFERLSEKRITKCVREALRRQHRINGVKVSCSAHFLNSRWHGVCWIGGQEFNYIISA